MHFVEITILHFFDLSFLLYLTLEAYFCVL